MYTSHSVPCSQFVCSRLVAYPYTHTHRYTHKLEKGQAKDISVDNRENNENMSPLPENFPPSHIKCCSTFLRSLAQLLVLCRHSVCRRPTTTEHFENKTTQHRSYFMLMHQTLVLCSALHITYTQTGSDWWAKCFYWLRIERFSLQMHSNAFATCKESSNDIRYIPTRVRVFSFSAEWHFRRYWYKLYFLNDRRKRAPCYDF